MKVRADYRLPCPSHDVQEEKRTNGTLEVRTEDVHEE